MRADQNNYLVENGIIKSHLIKATKLKAQTAQKYFDQMELAGYIRAEKGTWGEREINIYKVTKLGKQRYQWFCTINTEMRGGL